MTRQNRWKSVLSLVTSVALILPMLPTVSSRAVTGNAEAASVGNTVYQTVSVSRAALRWAKSAAV